MIVITAEIQAFHAALEPFHPFLLQPKAEPKAALTYQDERHSNTTIQDGVANMWKFIINTQVL